MTIFLASGKWLARHRMCQHRPGASVGRAAWCRTLALALLSGCAVGHITPAGEVYGAAIGRAKIEQCDADKQCSRIQGGALSTGVVELLEQAATAVAGWWAVP